MASQDSHEPDDSPAELIEKASSCAFIQIASDRESFVELKLPERNASLAAEDAVHFPWVKAQLPQTGLDAGNLRRTPVFAQGYEILSRDLCPHDEDGRTDMYVRMVEQLLDISVAEGDAAPGPVAFQGPVSELAVELDLAADAFTRRDPPLGAKEIIPDAIDAARVIDVKRTVECGVAFEVCDQVDPLGCGLKILMKFPR
jgi:hypothetical protein